MLFHSAAYAKPEPFRALCHAVDGINIDLKGFTEDFYRTTTGGQLAPVLDCLEMARASKKHLEVTNLVVPGYNDNLAQVSQMCTWVKTNLGADTPLHFSRFFPKYKMLSVPATPITTLEQVRKTAYECGLHYAYIGNVEGHAGASTYCPGCNQKLIRRIGYRDIANTGLRLPQGTCTRCGAKIPGVWQ